MALTPDLSRDTARPTGQRIRVVRPASIEPVIVGMTQARRALSGAADSVMRVAEAESQSHLETARAAQAAGDEIFEMAAGVIKDDAEREAQGTKIALDAQGRPIMPELGGNPLSIRDNAYREVIERRYGQSLITSLQGKAVELRGRGLNLPDFTREYNAFAVGTAKVVPEQYAGMVLDGAQRILQGHQMDLGQKELRVIRTADYSAQILDIKNIVRGADLAFAQGDIAEGRKQYNIVRERLIDLRDNNPVADRTAIGNHLARLNEVQPVNEMLGWAETTLAAIGEQDGLAGQMKFLVELGKAKGDDALYGRWIKDVDPKQLNAVIGVLKTSISLDLMKDRSVANALIFELLTDYTMGRPMVKPADLMQRVNDLHISEGAASQLLTKYISLQRSLTSGANRLKAPLERVHAALNGGWRMVARSNLEKEALEAILRSQMHERLGDPENVDQQDQIKNQYHWGNRASMGTVTAIARRLGIVPLGVTRVLGMGETPEDSVLAVEAATRMYQAIRQAGHLAGNVTPEQQALLSAVSDGWDMGVSTDATLATLKAKALGQEGMDQIYRLYGDPKAVGSAVQTPAGVTKANDLWNEAFTLAWRKAVLEGVGGSFLSSSNSFEENLALIGDGQMHLDPAMVAQGRMIFRKMAVGFTGPGDALMEGVAKQLRDGPRGWSGSLTTFSAYGSKRVGINYTQFALERFVSPDNVEMVNDHIRIIMPDLVDVGADIEDVKLGEGEFWRLSPANTEKVPPTYHLWYLDQGSGWTMVNEKGKSEPYQLDISPVIQAIANEPGAKDFFKKFYEFDLGETTDHVMEWARDAVKLSGLHPDAVGQELDDLAVMWQSRYNVSTRQSQDMAKMPMTAAGITADSVRAVINLIPEPARLLWESFEVSVIKPGIQGTGAKTVFTENDFMPSVLSVLRKASLNALHGNELEPGGSVIVSYPNYPKTARGLTAATIVGNGMSRSYRKIRENIYSKDVLGWSRLIYDVMSDPVMRATYSVGGFVLHRSKDGEYFIDDKFNFNGYHNRTKGDAYSFLRHILSKTEGAPQRTSQGPRVYLKLGKKL